MQKNNTETTPKKKETGIPLNFFKFIDTFKCCLTVMGFFQLTFYYSCCSHKETLAYK